MWATIIIAESFTRIMGSTAGNVYSTRTIVAVVSYSITLWILIGGGAEYPTGAAPLAPRWRRRCGQTSCDGIVRAMHYASRGKK